MLRRVFLITAVCALTGCVGHGVSGKEEALKAVRSAGPNTAVFFWPGSFSLGLERLAFYQDRKLITSVARGQVTTLALPPGQTEYDVVWEEAVELPAMMKEYFTADPNGPIFYVVAEGFHVISRSRRFERATREEMLAEIERAYP